MLKAHLYPINTNYISSYMNEYSGEIIVQISCQDREIENLFNYSNEGPRSLGHQYPSILDP